MCGPRVVIGRVDHRPESIYPVREQRGISLRGLRGTLACHRGTVSLTLYSTNLGAALNSGELRSITSQPLPDRACLPNQIGTALGLLPSLHFEREGLKD
jgi:hypothetical protein